MKTRSFDSFLKFVPGFSFRCFSVLILLFVILNLSIQVTFAHEEHAESLRTQKNDGQINLVQVDVPDLVLSNQDGRQGKLVSDFIGERMVAFTFVYTTCTTVCPILDGIFRKVQGGLGDELGKDYALVTLTIDSVIDAPSRLKEHTEKLGVKNGWNFLTGDRDTVKRILKGLEVYTPDIANHPPTVFIVDGSRGTWFRLNGFPSSSLIEQTMRQKLALR